MNNEKRSRRIFNFSLALVIVLAFIFGFQSAGFMRLLTKQDRIPPWLANAASSLSWDVHATVGGFNERDMTLLYEVLSHISSAYLHREDLDNSEIIQGAATGAVEALGDRYSRFVPPPDQQVLTEEIEGEYAGVGVSIIDRPGVLPMYALECETENGINPEDSLFLRETSAVVIVQVFETGPAYAAGLESNDVIVCVEGTPLRGAVADDAVALIKGPEGTQVEMTIWRPGLQEEMTFTVDRRIVHVPTVGKAEMLDDRIGYIRLDSFNNLSVEDVSIAVNDLLMQGMKGLIFDLRNNTGGVMTAAVGIADIFISDGNLVYYEDSDGRLEVFRSNDGGEALNMPLILLVNGNTASASEIVAGAVRDTRTGIIVGENTFGKGVVQNVYTLQDGSGLVLTTGRYLTPNQHAITEEGIEPDVISDLDPDRIRQVDSEVDDFLIRMDTLNQEFIELRQQMFDYLTENDFQRDTAIDLMDLWIDEGEVPAEWLEMAAQADLMDTGSDSVTDDNNGISE